MVFGLLVGVLRARLAGRPGALFFSYVGLYSVGRFAIEALRLDSFWLGAYRVPQLASMLGIIVAVAGKASGGRPAPYPAPRQLRGAATPAARAPPPGGFPRQGGGGAPSPALRGRRRPQYPH